jgi:ring-1,2-phenylacetyl-CoA epoxidase subunit PaaE
MSSFHPLEVTDVRHDTRDAVVLTLAPREQDRNLFEFTQGQYLTLRRIFDGEELRRCYSICAGKDEGVLRVGIKRVDGGAFSTWANEVLVKGDVIEAMPPAGKFFTPIDPAAHKHYLGFAGGSGITPVLSIIKTVLAREPHSKFTLVYANRQINAIMFRDELEDLKNRYLSRFAVMHVLETDAQEIDLFTGLVDANKMKTLFQHWIDPKSVDMAFICGPEPMMLTIAAALRENGIDDSRIKFELFASGQPGRAKAPAASRGAASSGAKVRASITMDGATRTVEMPREGQSLLEAALAAKIDAPYSCRGGVCSTCKARVVEGDVEMVANHALEDYEVRAGYVLMCQCYPISDRVSVTYDE